MLWEEIFMLAERTPGPYASTWVAPQRQDLPALD